MDEDAWTARRSAAPAPPRAHDPATSVARGVPLDVPFLQLTLFFVKASFAAALAVTFTSAVLLGLAGVVAGAGTGLYVAVGALRAPSPVAIAPATLPDASVAVAAPELPVLLPPPPVEEPPVVEAAVAPPPPSRQAVALHSPEEIQRSNAATDAAIRAQIERMRNNRR